tara:strand:+ start:93 stop:494 length:402 start_codon:yes stop_codon:yes gene_type:complete
MKKLLLTSLLCFCVSAYAANWKKIWENQNGDEMYIDLDNIENVKNRSIIFNIKKLSDFLEASGRGTLSLISGYKINCRTKQYAHYGEEIAYDQQMGQGKIIDRHNSGVSSFQDSGREGDFHHTLVKYVCDRAK